MSSFIRCIRYLKTFSSLFREKIRLLKLSYIRLYNKLNNLWRKTFQTTHYCHVLWSKNRRLFYYYLYILLFRRMAQTSPLPQLERPPRPGGRSRGSPPPPGIPATPREGGPTLPRGAGTPQHRSPAMSLVGRVGHLQNKN